MNWPKKNGMLIWKMKIINDCLDLIHQESDLVQNIRNKDLNSKWKILNDFLNNQNLNGWKKYRQAVFFEAQEQFGIDMGFCPYFTIDFEENMQFNICTADSLDRPAQCFGADKLCPYKKYKND